MKSAHSRQAKERFRKELRHRVNAGRVAVRNQVPFFRRQFGQVTSEWKEDDTRVTFADFAISEKVFAELRRDFAGDAFCSEEASPADESIDIGGDFAWVIDPIDGTNNYALGFPVCAMSLGLLHGGEPVYGFVYDHAADVLYEGGPGFGVFRDRRKLGAVARRTNEQTVIGLHFPMERHAIRALAGLMERYRVRSLGSAALTACYVATGYLSGVIDFRVKVWDIAAGHALIRGAGLGVDFLESAPFPMRKFHPLAPRCPYAAGDERFRQEITHLF